MTKHEDMPYLQHIAEAIRNIESFSKNLTKEKFLKNSLRQSAIIRQLEIIGEAAKNVSENTRKNYPQVVWKEIAGTRDKIIHHYFGVNLNIIWDIVKKDILQLKKKIKAILEEESKDE